MFAKTTEPKPEIEYLFSKHITHYVSRYKELDFLFLIQTERDSVMKLFIHDQERVHRSYIYTVITSSGIATLHPI